MPYIKASAVGGHPKGRKVNGQRVSARKDYKKAVFTLTRNVNVNGNNSITAANDGI